MNLPILTRLHQKMQILHHKEAIKSLTNPHTKMTFNPKLEAMLNQIESLENRAEQKSPGAKAKFGMSALKQMKIDKLESENADLRAQVAAKTHAPAPSAAKPSPSAPKPAATGTPSAPSAPAPKPSAPELTGHARVSAFFAAKK